MSLNKANSCQFNSYYDDPHDATGRFPFGLPRTDNANGYGEDSLLH